MTEGAIGVDVEEAQVDVSDDRSWRFTHGVFDEEGPVHAPGIRATYFVPFTGDGELFKCAPSTFTTVHPFAELGNQELRLTVERPDQDVAATKKWFEEELSRTKQYLGWVRENATQFNTSLPQTARQRITGRKSRLEQRKSTYVVMFISEHYVKKAWPSHERTQAQARALVAKEEYILPARFDDTEVPGMTATVAHIDLRKTTPSELVGLILGKLGKG